MQRWRDGEEVGVCLVVVGSVEVVCVAGEHELRDKSSGSRDDVGVVLGLATIVYGRV